MHVTRDDIDNFSSEELANFARLNSADDVVISTIMEEHIHGKLVHELADEDLMDLAEGRLNYKRLTSALHSLEEAENWKSRHEAFSTNTTVITIIS